MEKPSCIKELKRIATNLFDDPRTEEAACLDQIKNVFNLTQLTDSEKLLKIKQICKENGL
jgi:hypothetical protein